MGEPGSLPFDQLDYLYTPSSDVARDAGFLVRVLGGELEFTIDDGGTRVAMVRVSREPPAILLTDHLEGDRPIHVYRVASLAETRHSLEGAGWAGGTSIELPPGPAISFEAPGGLRFAVYEPTRPFVVESFVGRHDFEV